MWIRENKCNGKVAVLIKVILGLMIAYTKNTP
jgi:hypothetical protein